MTQPTCRRYPLRGILCLTAAALCLLALLFSCRIVYSSGSSMQPTLSDGQLLIGMPTCNPFVTPQPGDIVIVRNAAGGCNLVKRLIAVPGETLGIRSDRVYINGRAICEPYLSEAMVTEDVAPFTLGEDMYYVLGDNRNVSADSRCYGTFSGADILCVVDLQHQWLHWGLFLLLSALALLFARVMPAAEAPH